MSQRQYIIATSEQPSHQGQLSRAYTYTCRYSFQIETNIPWITIATSILLSYQVRLRFWEYTHTNQKELNWDTKSWAQISVDNHVTLSTSWHPHQHCTGTLQHRIASHPDPTRTNYLFVQYSTPTMHPHYAERHGFTTPCFYDFHWPFFLDISRDLVVAYCSLADCFSPCCLLLWCWNKNLVTWGVCWWNFLSSYVSFLRVGLSRSV